MVDPFFAETLAEQQAAVGVARFDFLDPDRLNARACRAAAEALVSKRDPIIDNADDPRQIGRGILEMKGLERPLSIETEVFDRRAGRDGVVDLGICIMAVSIDEVFQPRDDTQNAP